MPGYWINGGAVAGSLHYYAQNTILDEERGTLYRPADRWDRNRRSQSSQTDQSGYTSLWPFSGFFLDPSGTTGLDGVWGNDDLANAYGMWEPWRLGNKGTTRPYYLTGVVYDTSNVPVQGAIIDSFITATDVKDGTTTTSGDGTYQVPCYNRTAQHYVTAYKTGSPDSAGESANTLVPTL